MSNVYLKVTIKKNWPFQNFDFLSLKNLSSGQFLGDSEFSSYEIELWNRVTENDVTLWVTNSKILIEILLLSY